MARKYSLQYIEQLLDRGDLHSLVKLYNALCSWVAFTRDKTDYGFPRPIFAFVEIMGWSGTHFRSRIPTYYETTPLARQEATLQALIDLAPEALTNAYRRGMLAGRDEGEIDIVDDWIELNEEIVNQWLWTLLRRNRQQVDDLLA